MNASCQRLALLITSILHLTMAHQLAGYLLCITVSTRGPASYSLRLLDQFKQSWQQQHPGKTVITRDVNAIPHLDFESLTAGRTPVEQHTPEMREQFKLADELTLELTGASAVVIATPMYNWSAPSALKAWIDRVVNTRTFYAKTHTLKGVPITCIVVSGGPYSADAGVPALMPRDHLRPWLKTTFSMIGGEDLVFVNGDPTGPIDMGKVAEDDEASGMTRARKQIPDAAARIKAPSEPAARDEL